jgi:hypothetical protein
MVGRGCVPASKIYLRAKKIMAGRNKLIASFISGANSIILHRRTTTRINSFLVESYDAKILEFRLKKGKIGSKVARMKGKSTIHTPNSEHGVILISG